MNWRNRERKWIKKKEVKRKQQQQFCCYHTIGRILCVAHKHRNRPPRASSFSFKIKIKKKNNNIVIVAVHIYYWYGTGSCDSKNLFIQNKNIFSDSNGRNRRCIELYWDCLMNFNGFGPFFFLSFWPLKRWVEYGICWIMHTGKCWRVRKYCSKSNGMECFVCCAS